MKEFNLNDAQFVNSIVPKDLAFCFNEACSKTSKCIHFIAGKFKSPTKTVGYAVFPDAMKDGKCEHFLRPKVMMAAWGFKTLYDEVKHSDLTLLRQEVMSLLGGKTSYYRYHRGERLLTPEQQTKVLALFKRKGYEAPHFDGYKETVGFTDKEE